MGAPEPPWGSAMNLPLRWASGVSLAVVVLLVAVAVGCAARRQASDMNYDYDGTPGREFADAETPEELLRERDTMRLESYQQLQREMDDGVSSMDENMEDDYYYYEEVEPPGVGERTGNAMQKAGLVAWSVFTVAFTLGMAALPFLI